MSLLSLSRVEAFKLFLDSSKIVYPVQVKEVKKDKNHTLCMSPYRSHKGAGGENVALFMEKRSKRTKTIPCPRIGCIRGRGGDVA